MHPLDHVYALALLIALPVYGAWSWRRWLARLAAGHRPRRLRLYLGSLGQLWFLFLLLAALWWYLDRAATALGFSAPAGTGFWIGAALVLAGTAVFLRSWLGVRAAGEADRSRYRAQLGELGQMMPHDRREYGVFVLLSVTAGIVEETLFRGYLLWYLVSLMPLWAAVIVSSLAFGLAHSYQGMAGIAKTGAAGLALALLYLLSGSLWLPIVAHALVDILQGATMLEIFRQAPAVTAAQTTDGEAATLDT